MSEQIVTPGEPLLIEITVDWTYIAIDPCRVYGWQIKNLGGDVISYHYHAAAHVDEADASARQRFGADHRYTVEQPHDPSRP